MRSKIVNKMNFDILEQIFKYSDVDTKVNLRKAYPEYKFINSKLSPDRLVDVKPWNQTCEKYYGMYGIETMYIYHEWWYIAYWGPYRCIKNICDLCMGTSYITFTANKIDIPGISSYVVEVPWQANNWLGKVSDNHCAKCRRCLNL
jgi:hypothetical protein